MRFMKKLNELKSKLKSKTQKKDSHYWLKDDYNLEKRHELINKENVKKSLDENIENIRKILGKSDDLIINSLELGDKDIKAAAINIDGLQDSRGVERIFADITGEIHKTNLPASSNEEIFETIHKKISSNEEVTPETEYEKIFDKLLIGETVILIDGIDKALIFDTKSWDVRQVEEPETERTIRGSRDGFVESVKVNTALIRRRIRSPNFWIESMDIGRVTKTKVSFAYLKGLANEDLINEVRTRLQKIDTDRILESGEIEEFIMDTPYTIFPLVHKTERTDIVTSNILEGKVAIFTQGTPIVLSVPNAFDEMLQAPDDYNEIFPIGSFIRLGRQLGFLISMLLPGFYVAIFNFHTELVPTSLLLRVTAARQGVPFPKVIEVLLMEFAFELLREAGLRLPGMIGPAISIVGALILGEAAIQAGIVSPAVVIIVALTAIASFMTPSFSLSISGRILRFVIILAGATMGLFGVQFIFILVAIHLASLRSFGYPFFAPLAPLIISDWGDFLVRIPWWAKKVKPKLTTGRSPNRFKGKKQFMPSGLETRDEPYSLNEDKRNEEGNNGKQGDES
ncbi:spore germination protein [Natranaerofaba carboxydovora]|uniref:spore germination protein n=1 Tax=Natranaerofaba carboxydovora TaxID=2742683 RepID=UPI001F12B94A|nr:spore germination protein [Natranaerofaba carboxydovora]UMZ72620.1 Spore germination protein B1 [Natranaerofaba carboxydovora]